MGAEHQQLGLQYGGVAQRHMHGHLVTVKVGVESGTCQRMQPYSLALHKFRLEGLDTQTVQRRGTVQQNGVTLQNILQYVPDYSILAVHNLFCRFDRLDNAALQQLADNEWLEQFGSHILRQAAFVQVQIRPDNDDGTAGIVHTLTEQVLTETALLSLKVVGK